MTATLVFKADTSAFDAAIAEFCGLLAKLPEGVADHLVCLVDVPHQLCRIDSNLAAAAGAGELVVRLQPSDRLVRFLEAMRAGDLDALIGEHGREIVRHGLSSGGGLAMTSGDDGAGESQGASAPSVTGGGP